MKAERTVKVRKTYKPTGVEFGLSLHDAPAGSSLLVELPFDYRKTMSPSDYVRQDTFVVISALEELLLSGDLVPVGSTYLLPWKNLYELASDVQRDLGVPEQANHLSIALKSHSTLGSPKFAIRYRLYDRSEGQLFGKRQGAVFLADSGDTLLLPSHIWKLCALVDDVPADRSGHPEYLARVRKVALQIGAQLDRYLASEEYYFSETMDIRVEEKALDCILLEPDLSDLPAEVKGCVDIANLANRGVCTHAFGDKRRRVIASKELRASLNETQGIKELRDQDVPRFLSNPHAFLPPECEDVLDLERFGDRVKGLAKKVYRARPYVHARSGEENRRRLFDFDYGVTVSPLLEDSDGQTQGMSMEQFRQICSDARERGDEFVRWNDGWLQIPRNAGEFVDAIARFESLKEDRQTGDVSRPNQLEYSDLPYVLEIFRNIDLLEYNTEMLHLLSSDAASIADPSLPASFKGQLRPYQEDGYLWMKVLRWRRLGGLCADDMGLGKTVQVIAYMSHLHQEGELRPSIVVVPAAITENWIREMNRFCPSLHTYLHIGRNRERAQSLVDIANQCDVLVTTYETLVRDQLWLAQVNWQVVVADEAQKIKNFTTRASDVVKALKGGSRLALTGTPVENTLGELWSIIDYIQPGLLGSYQQFQRSFEKPINNLPNAEAIQNRLIGLIQPVYLRRTKELLNELPPISEQVIKVGFSPTQLRLYKELIHSCQREPGRILKILGKLIQLCSHPQAYLDDPAIREAVAHEGVPKLEATLSILDDVAVRGEKALVFTLYRNVQQILKRQITLRYDLSPVVINGEVFDRLSLCEQFNEYPGFNVMILSPRAAGIGLNITGANHVIHYTRWWNPAVERQATDRVHRIGQTRPVTIYYPIVTSHPPTIEDHLASLHSTKKRLAENVVVPSRELRISEEELARLVLESTPSSAGIES